MAEILIFVFGLAVGGALGAFFYYLYAKARIDKLRLRLDYDSEKIEWIQDAQENLRETFEALAARSLHANAQDFSGRIHQQLASHSQHIDTVKTSFEKTITQLDGHIRELETKREGAYRLLSQHVINLEKSFIELSRLTSQLNNALSSGPVRGRWGEIQLRKIIELAGLTEHVSFNEQIVGTMGRPDMVVHLPNEGQLPIDSKFPLHAYLEAVAATDETLRKRKFQDHAKALRQSIKDLSQKCYWEQCQPAPEIVIMFVPIEACLMLAYEIDPTVFEYALENKVVLASPITLLGFMKSIAFGWQQFTISKNAKVILEQGRELFKRTAKWLEHFRSVGTKLESAVESYNASVSSLQTRFFPAVRRFQELAAIKDEVVEVAPIDSGIKLAPRPEDVE